MHHYNYQYYKYDYYDYHDYKFDFYDNYCYYYDYTTTSTTSTTTYDSAQVPKSFSDLGSGYCNSGYYAGWVAEDAVDLETCEAKCLTEPECKFISLNVGHSCSRYNSEAGSCNNRWYGHADHESYARTS